MDLERSRQQASQAIFSIYKRCEAGRSIKQLSLGSEAASTHEVLASVRNKSTGIARSENIIDQVQAVILLTRIQRTREGLMALGLEIDHEFGTRSLALSEEITAIGDDTENYSSSVKDYLRILDLSEEREITIEYGFNNKFSLEIDYVDSESPRHLKERYRSGEVDLDAITDEEHKIVEYYLSLVENKLFETPASGS